MAYHRYGEPSPGNAALQGEAYGAELPPEVLAEMDRAAETPPRFWTPGFMIAAIALLAAWWLRKH